MSATDPNGQKRPIPIKKLYIRGTISNSVALGSLFALAYFLDIQFYVGLALGIQYAVFLLHGLPNRSEKFYDMSGSFTHLAVVASALLMEDATKNTRQLFAALAATVWMTRLGTFLYNRILRDGRDERFDKIKMTWISFMGAWSLQALWVTIVELPVILLSIKIDAVAQNTPVNVIDCICMIGWFVGFLIEAAADTQKMAFRNLPENKNKWINSGIWRYSKQPNYFGEILMWSCLAALCSSTALVSGVSHLNYLHAAWLSPVFTYLLLFFVSGVPLLKAAGMKKWGNDPEYLHYVNNTSLCIPWAPASPFNKTN